MTVIATNTTAQSAINYLNRNSMSQSNDVAQLASGSQITSAKDDASGLAVATGMASDASVLQQGATNLQSGTAVLNTADGALSNIADILTRMKTLTAQAQSGSSSTADLGYMNDEYQQLSTQITNITTQTTFNGTALLDGSTGYSNGTGVTFMVGTGSSDTLSVNVGGKTDLTTLGIDGSALDATTAGAKMDALTTAINTISGYRAQVGAQLSAMSFQSSVINTSLQNLNAAKSSITDADIAQVQSKFSTDQTMTSAAVSALSDANQMNQQVLKLLG